MRRRASTWAVALFGKWNRRGCARGRAVHRTLAFERVENRNLLAADLTLDITDGEVQVSPADSIVYNYEYANIGDMDATSAVLHTLLPRNTSFNAEQSHADWSCTQGRFPWSRTGCRLQLGNVAAQQSGTVPFAVTVDAEVSARVRSISNFGYISGDQRSARRDNFGYETTLLVRQLHDLRLDLSNADSEAMPGSVITYVLDYSNAGVVDAPGATISMKVPTHTSFDAAASSAGWTCDEEATCTLQLGDVAPGAEGSANFAVKVPKDLSSDVRRIRATASISGDEHGPADANHRNNRRSNITAVVHVLPDLSVDIDDANVATSPGETIIYTVAYANAGTFDATGVVLTFHVPASTTFDPAASSKGWACEENVCSLAVGNLASDMTGSATFAVTVDPELSPRARSIRASASISDDGSAGGDLNSRDNVARERTSVRIDRPDVAIEIVAGEESVMPGGRINYTISYTNEGTSEANGVVVRVRVPRHTKFSADGSSPGWTCDRGLCTLEVGSLAPGAAADAALAVTVDADLSSRSRHVYALASISDDVTSGRDANVFNNFALDRTSVMRA